MKQKWKKHAAYVQQGTIALSVVASEFSNYYNLLIIALNSTTFDIIQNLYCNAYWQER